MNLFCKYHVKRLYFTLILRNRTTPRQSNNGFPFTLHLPHCHSHIHLLPCTICWKVSSVLFYLSLFSALLQGHDLSSQPVCTPHLSSSHFLLSLVSTSAALRLVPLELFFFFCRFSVLILLDCLFLSVCLVLFDMSP